MDAEAGKQRGCGEGKAEMGKQLEEEEEEEAEDSGYDQLKCSATRSSQDKQDRIKIKKGKGVFFEEDVIDGFAILSFTSLDELEIVTKRNGCVKSRPLVDENARHKDISHEDDDGENRTKKRRPKKAGILNNCCLDGGDAGDSSNSCSISSDNGSSASIHIDNSLSNHNGFSITGNNGSIGLNASTHIGSMSLNASSHTGLISLNASTHTGLISLNASTHTGLISLNASIHNGAISPNVSKYSGLTSPNISADTSSSSISTVSGDNHQPHTNGKLDSPLSTHGILDSSLPTRPDKLDSPLPTRPDRLDSQLPSRHDKLDSPLPTRPDRLDSQLPSRHDKLDSPLPTRHDKLDSPLPTRHDRLHDCDVEVDVGDDTVSEPVPAISPSSIVGGFLCHLTGSSQNHCVTFSVPTPPPSTPTTPLDPFTTPVQQILLVATTTATTTTIHTSTTSPTRSGVSDSLITTATTSQSVITPQLYPRDHQGVNPSPQSPQSSCPYNRTLSPNQRHHSDNSDNSTCARSLQYSRLHKPSPTQGKSKDSNLHHSPNNYSTDSSKLHFADNSSHATSDNHRTPNPQNGPNHLNHHTIVKSLDHTHTSYAGNGYQPGSGPQLQRPDYHPNQESQVAAESGLEKVVNTGVSRVASSAALAANTDGSLAVKSAPREHSTQEQHHHSSATKHQRPNSSSSNKPHQPNSHHNHINREHNSKDHSNKDHSNREHNSKDHSNKDHSNKDHTNKDHNSKDHTNKDHSNKDHSKDHTNKDHSKDHTNKDHNNKDHRDHSHRDNIQSPVTHPTKRVCRTPTSSATTTIFSDASKHYAPHFTSWPQAGRLGGLAVSFPVANPKDSTDNYNNHTDDKHSLVGSYHNLHNHNLHNHHIRQHRDEREHNHPSVSQSAPISSACYPSAKGAWSSSPGHLYTPLIQNLHLQHSPLTPTSSSSSLIPHTFATSLSSHTSPLFQLPLAHTQSLLSSNTSSLPSGMFAPSLHHTPHSLSSTTAVPSHPALSSQLPSETLLRAGQDYLHQDLNNRLLAHHEPSTITLQSSPFVRNETHQHQHLHNHMHQHTYGGLSTDPLIPQVGPLFDKIPKSFEAGVFRPSFEKIPKAFDAGMFVPNIVPSYSAAFASLLPAIRSGTVGLQGAFQPKSLSTAGQMFVSFRDREKAAPQPGVPLQKKHGKWCSVHVRVAWEIFHRQQKKMENDTDGSTYSTSSSKPGLDMKPLEPLLHPASHLLPGGGAPPRTPETSLLSSMARGYPDGMTNTSTNFMSSAAQLGLPHLPRSSPYATPAMLNPLSFSGLGGGIFAADMASQGLASNLRSSPHDWTRLHRTPASFPTWSRADAEREKDRERDLRKEEESYRERRGATNQHRSSFDDVRLPEASRPRSRSRSPLVNGRLDFHAKPELGHYDKRPLSASSSVLRLKEDDLASFTHHLAERERRERDRIERERMDSDRLDKERIGRERLERERSDKEKLLQAVEQRDKFFQASGYLGLNSLGAVLPHHPGLLDRRMGLMGHPATSYPFLDRPPVPTSLWGTFDKTAELAHRLEFERERERMAMMSRLSGVPSHLAAVEQERLREHLIREHHEQEYDIHRQRVDRMPSFSSDRLRSMDPLSMGSYFPRTISPMYGPVGLAGLKNSSPHGIPVAPPPLIHSSSANLMPRTHDNSPSSSSRFKGLSPADSTSDLKDRRDVGHPDPDTHNR